jgi:hypothetical protein
MKRSVTGDRAMLADRADAGWGSTTEQRDGCAAVWLSTRNEQAA